MPSRFHGSSRDALVAMAAIAIVIAAQAIAAHPIAAQQPRFDERVEVARIIIDARVLDDRGQPVAGLTADDFKVTIDGKPVRVETATWVGERSPNRATATPPAAPVEDASSPIAPGRLIVFLFQKDLEPSRIIGLMRMLMKSRNLLQTLNPEDRVAILSFESHLSIWSDFTNNREQLDRVLSHGLLFERPPTAPAASSPSLIERLDPATGRKVYGIERALELIGAALEPLPGSKSLVLVGHGFGRLGRGGVSMENDYGPARHALAASRTSVFSLDVTDADYHSLDAGLQLIAEETGGFYARTHLFPSLAMRRLSGALAGYYVLFVDKQQSQRTSHVIEVKLMHSNAQLLFSSSYSEAKR